MRKYLIHKRMGLEVKKILHWRPHRTKIVQNDTFITHPLYLNSLPEPVIDATNSDKIAYLSVLCSDES